LLGTRGSNGNGSERGGPKVLRGLRQGIP
jgi:hypothetical protein